MTKILEDFHRRLKQLEHADKVFEAEKRALWRVGVPVFGAVWYIVQRRNGFYGYHPLLLSAGMVWSNITSVYLPFTVWQVWSG